MPVLKRTCRKLNEEILMDFVVMELVEYVRWVAVRDMVRLVEYRSASASEKRLAFTCAILASRTVFWSVTFPDQA